MDTFSDVIDLWPSLRDFADDVGASYERAKGWRRRNSIPAEYWRRVLDAASKRAIPLRPETLILLSEKAA